MNAMKNIVLSALVSATIVSFPAAAEAPRELHWKSTMQIPGMSFDLPSETWVKGDKVRVVTDTPVGKAVTVVKGKTVYINSGGLAIKTTVDAAPKGTQPADFARNLDDLLKNGTKLGTETVDGEACEKWKTTRTDGSSSTEMLLWISPSLKFPRKVVVKDETRGEITFHNTDIERTVTLDDKLFEPEPGVDYKDMSDVIRSGGASPK